MRRSLNYPQSSARPLVRVCKPVPHCSSGPRTLFRPERSSGSSFSSGASNNGDINVCESLRRYGLVSASVWAFGGMASSGPVPQTGFQIRFFYRRWPHRRAPRAGCDQGAAWLTIWFATVCRYTVPSLLLRSRFLASKSPPCFEMHIRRSTFHTSPIVL